MRWLFFVFAAACFFIAFRTQSMGLAALCLLLALGLMFAGVFALASHRIQSRARNEISIVSPEELRRLREEAERKRAAGSSASVALPRGGDDAPPGA